jgi:phosphopantothenoylcysteine decarboxylase/phosphopantothenate--cysteine ligase
MFFDKKILVGVSGGIAAYKAAFLVRELKKLGAQVRVVMTDAAIKFVAPLTFEALSEHKVALHVFEDGHDSATAHIDWARWPDVVIICPATANTVGKLANGIADNMLTTLVMATTVPVVVCPAMNVEMYKNPVYQRNEKALSNLGFHIVQPGSGELACGETGVGRLAESSDIVKAVEYVLFSSSELKGKKVLVTAGPTREAIDPVRYLTNRSSGKMGYALAKQAALRGADVTLITGPTQLDDPYNVKVQKVFSAQEMANAVVGAVPNCDVLIMSAAVADFRPAQVSAQKIKKHQMHNQLELEPTIDILKAASELKTQQFFIGFALETENEVDNARNKMQRKKCDLLVLNNPLEKGAGFDVDTNKVTLLKKDGSVKELPLMSKEKVAHAILDEIEI